MGKTSRLKMLEDEVKLLREQTRWLKKQLDSDGVWTRKWIAEFVIRTRGMGTASDLPTIPPPQPDIFPYPPSPRDNQPV